MPPFAELVLAFAWTFGANGFLIERQMAGVETSPSEWLRPVADRAIVVFHAREDWAMAFFVEPGDVAGVASSSEAGPRIALFAPYYLAPDGLITASRMPVDVAEYYFHALIEAVLDLKLAEHATFADEIRARANALMTDVPAEHRIVAYTSALADFGAHLLSIRNEISRVVGRQAVAGRDLCRLIEHPASLFGLWRRSLADGRYGGGYFVAESDGPPRWTENRQPLERADKDRFLAEVFGVAWSGEPRQDFASLCPGS